MLWATCNITKNKLLLREFIFSTSVSIEANPQRVCRRKSALHFLIMWTSWRYLNEQRNDIFHILMGTGESGILMSNKFWLFLFFSFLLFFFLFFFFGFSFPASVTKFFSYYLCICLYLIFCNLFTLPLTFKDKPQVTLSQKSLWPKSGKRNHEASYQLPISLPFSFTFCSVYCSFATFHLFLFVSFSLFFSTFLCICVGSIIYVFLCISSCCSRNPLKTLIVTWALIFMMNLMTENDKKI
jgi:hypothetical protein